MRLSRRECAWRLCSILDDFDCMRLDWSPNGSLGQNKPPRGKSRSTTPAPAATCSSNRKFLRGPCLSHEPGETPNAAGAPLLLSGKGGRARDEEGMLPAGGAAAGSARAPADSALTSPSSKRAKTLDGAHEGGGAAAGATCFDCKDIFICWHGAGRLERFPALHHDAFATTCILFAVCCHRPSRRSQRPLLPSSGQLQAKCQRMWYSGSIGRIWSK